MELKHRSKVVVEGDERAAHRAYLRDLGLSDEEMSKPFIGIINSWGEFHPGHIVLRSFAEVSSSSMLKKLPLHIKEPGLKDNNLLLVLCSIKL